MVRAEMAVVRVQVVQAKVVVDLEEAAKENREDMVLVEADQTRAETNGKDLEVTNQEEKTLEKAEKMVKGAVQRIKKIIRAALKIDNNQKMNKIGQNQNQNLKASMLNKLMNWKVKTLSL